MTDPYLTVAEVARLLQVDVKTVRGDIKAGRLRAVRVGERGHYRIPPDALADLPSAANAARDEQVTAIRRPRRPRPARVQAGAFR